MRENDILNDYLHSLFGIELLTVEEEHELARRIQEGDDSALDKLVTHNLRFVVYVVRNMTAWNHGKVPVLDLVSMGNEAIVIAARRWVPKNNARFATYAKQFIRMGVRRELDNTANMIRLPINIMEQIKKLNYNDRALTQILGRKPTIAELSKVTGFSETKIYRLRGCIAREPISLEIKDNENHYEELHDD